MTRIAKAKDPDRLEAIESARSAVMRTDIDFAMLEEALGVRYKITAEQRSEIEFAIAFACEGRVRARPQGRMLGRPKQNQEWEVLIQSLADLFQSITRKRATINSRNDKKPNGSSPLEFGPFWTFAKCIFEQIPKEIIRPTDTALVPLIKRSLWLRAGRNRAEIEKKKTKIALRRLPRRRVLPRLGQKALLTR